MKWITCVLCLTSCGFSAQSQFQQTLPLLLRKPEKSVVSTSGINDRREPPQFMLDLYRDLSLDHKDAASLPYGATIVRALAVQDEGSQFSFPLGKVPDAEEEVLGAHLRFHQHQLESSQRKMLGKQNLYKLELYSVNGDSEELLEYQVVTGHFGGWRHFKISKVLRNITSSEIFFKIKASTLHEDPLQLQNHYHSFKKPLVVLFTKPHKDTESPFPQEIFADNRLTRQKRSLAENETTSLPPPEGCELRDLLVDFNTIGWASWVLSPMKFNAYQCSGRCEFPLGQDNHPTNHVTLLSIMNFISTPEDHVSHPCCTPTGYKGLPLLYYDDSDNVVLRKFDNMVATECACR